MKFDFVSILCYDGDGTGGGDGDGDGDGGGGDGGGGGGGGDTVFTQEDVNRFLAEHKRTLQDRVKELESNSTKLEGSYQELLKNQGLSTDERNSLEQKLEDLKKSQLTEKQRIEYERKQSEESFETQLETERTRADRFETLYKGSTVDRSLQDAVSTSDAFNARQIVSLLKPMVKLKEEEGNFTVMVDFPDIDEKTGNEITTLRTPSDAVKRMRELPKVWGNLFKSNVVSGVGAGQANTDVGEVDYSSLTPEEYRKRRADIKAQLERERQ